MNHGFFSKIIFLIFFCCVSFLFVPCILANNVDVSAIILPLEEEVIPGGGGAILFKDIIFLANVSFFIAKPGNEEIFLSWLNPENLDFAFVQIERKEDFFSLAPGQGFLIYNGKDQSFLDKNLINGKKYYYTIWAYDTAGNFSSGAIAFAVPQKILSPEIAPLKKIAPLKIIPLKRILSPEITLPKIISPKEVLLAEIAPILPTTSVVPAIPIISKINLEDFSLFINSVEIKPRQAEIRTLPNFPLTFFISAEKFKQTPEIIQIILYNQIFLLSLDKEAKFYSGTIKAPEKPGQYSLDIFFIYKENIVETIKTKILVENFGQTLDLINKKLNKLYKKLNLKEKIEGVRVALYSQNSKTSKWEIWPGQDYNQENSQITNKKGEYGFMVSPGRYYLLFSKKGYLSKTIKEFEPENNIINFKVDIISWRILLIIGGLIFSVLIAIIVFLRKLI